jgi:hypothetical protein
MKRIFTAIAVFCVLGCAHLPAPSTNSSLIGTWRLLEFWNQRDPSKAREYPFGESPLGYIVYDATGHVFVQIERNPPPPRLERGALQKATAEELRGTLDAYIAYFGTYTIDPTRKIVVHHVEGDVGREYTGTDQERPFRLVGDELFIGDGKGWLRRFVRLK